MEERATMEGRRFELAEMVKPQPEAEEMEVLGKEA